MRRIRLFVTLIIVLAAGAPEASAVFCLLMRSAMAMEAGAPPEASVTDQPTVSQCPLSRCVSPIVARLAEPPTATIAPVPHRLVIRPDADRLIRSAEAPPLPPPKRQLSLI